MSDPPSLLIVPTLDSSVAHPSGFGRIDLLSMLSSDSALANLLASYRETARAGAFRVLRREPRGSDVADDCGASAVRVAGNEGEHIGWGHHPNAERARGRITPSD